MSDARLVIGAGGLPCGVFAWRPPGAMVAELSDVLDRGAR